MPSNECVTLAMLMSARAQGGDASKRGKGKHVSIKAAGQEGAEGERDEQVGCAHARTAAEAAYNCSAEAS